MGTEDFTKLEQQIKILPDSPGVYQYYDASDRLLYVGKAKNLKKRVSSYFTKSHDSARLRVLVRKIDRIEFIVVKTEIDALLLENNLIKKNRPRYNIMLRDDKTYPWICIKKERFPRVFSTRRVIKDGSEYYGPYASVRVMRNLLELIRSLYPLRTCAYPLLEEPIAAGKYKKCLEYHIGKCLAPCEGLQDERDYNADLEKVRALIKGQLRDVQEQLHRQMVAHAESMEFEAAHAIKQKLDLLEKYQSRSTVVSPTVKSADVFSITTDVQAGYVNYLRVINGAVVNSHSVEIRKRLEESPAELLERGFVEMVQIFKLEPKEVLLSEAIDLEIDGVIFRVPQRGDKRHLVDLSLRNAKHFRMDKLKQMQLVDPDRHTNRLMAQMKTDLRLSEEPRHIECFDNSNIQGSNPVAACVVFTNGKPDKKAYRHFNIKSVEGPNDFASMEEVVYRRYKRLLEEGAPLPQLIVIDGGKGQLSSALKSLEVLGLRGKVAIIGIAKRLEEIYFPGDSIPLYLDKKSESLKVIQQLRNEAHRFGITFHRQKRSSNALSNALEEIPGIGPATANTLLRHFKSVKRVKDAPQSEVAELIGLDKAKKISDHFKTDSPPPEGPK
jgi:excinuclease ABC subunit C